MCEELGWILSDTFAQRFRVVLMVVCVDPALVEESTKDIQGSWGSGKNRDLVKKAFIKAVKEADANEIKYPKTLDLFKKLFPTRLN